MRFGIRVVCDGSKNVSVFAARWSGQTIIHKNDPGCQIFDILPPMELRGAVETLNLATMMVKLIREDGAEAEIIEVQVN